MLSVDESSVYNLSVTIPATLIGHGLIPSMDPQVRPTEGHHSVRGGTDVLALQWGRRQTSWNVDPPVCQQDAKWRVMFLFRQRMHCKIS